MKILVIGCGSIGTRHACNAARFADVAVFDKDQELAAKAAALAGGLSCTDIEKALRWGADGVVVATPNHLHLSIATQVVKAGIDVLIEKPLAPSLDGVLEFQQLVAEMETQAFVVCNMRFHPAIHTLFDNLHLIGQPLFARAHVGNYLPNMRPDADYRSLYCANRNQGGGVILDAIHEVDYLMWLLGGVKEVACTAKKLSSLAIDVEDFASLCLTHENNVISEIQMDYLRPFKRRGCEIVGDNGMLLWQSEGKQPEKCSVRFFDNKEQVWQTLFATDSIDTAAPYILLMEEFVSAVAGEETSLLTVDTAAEELSIVLQALIVSGILTKAN